MIECSEHLNNTNNKSDHAKLGGKGNCITLRTQSDISFLSALRGHQGVDCFRFDIVQIFECSLDLYFVSTGMNRENNSIAFGHGLVGFLGVDWVDQH